MSMSTKTTQKKAPSDKSVFRKQANTKTPVKQNSPAQEILNLHQTIGNRGVQRLFESGFIQGKLTVGEPNDKYEQEADRVADDVMRMPEPQVQRQSDEDEEEEMIQTKPIGDQITPLVQRQVEPEEEEEETLQTKSNGQTPQITSNLELRINSLQGSGEPLSKETRNFFEPRFGHDFSGVRVHNDSNANQLARSINAKAFTQGSNIVFGGGEYSPGSQGGKRLLGHELTHVMQQNGAPTLFSPGKNSENTIPNSPELKTRPTYAAKIIKPFEPNEMSNDRVPKTSVEIDGSSTTKVTETVVATQAITPGTTPPIATQRRGSTPSILPKEETKETEEKWPIGWYRRYARDEQAVELFEYWVKGHGGELVLENEKWKKYMMNNERLEKQIIKELTTDALTRKKWLERYEVTKLSGKVDIIRFPAKIENGYRTGYELLHGTNEDVGDFEIEGNFIVKKDLKIPNAINVDYELEFVWNDIEDPLKDHFTDEMAALFFELFSYYNPKSYAVRIRWKANALINIKGGCIWGGIL